MRLDSSIAVAPRAHLPPRFLLSLHQPAEFVREFDASDTTRSSMRITCGCGHATSMHRRIHLACASSFRCQTTALSRGSSFDRIGCLPTRRHGPGQDFPAPAPHRHVCKHGKCSSALSSSFTHPAPPVNARTASRLPCRSAATLPRAPTQAPLPDSGFSSTRAINRGHRASPRPPESFPG